MTITEFLLARIAEDEAVATAATPGPWEWMAETSEWGDCGPNLETVAKLTPWPDGSVSPVDSVITAWGHDAWGLNVEDADKAHIARYDPARVLAECAAKRAIIESKTALDGRDLKGDPVRCGMYSALSDVVEDLAAVYADHPDYRQEWTL